MVIQNDKGAQLLNWKDYKIYLLMKDGVTMIQNYTTVAKTGNYTCTYTVEPGKSHVQLLCFGKKFNSDDVGKVWIRMTDSNFIDFTYYKSIEKGNSGGRYPDFGGSTIAGARTLLETFLDPNSNHAALTAKLRPTEQDYKAYFTDATWQNAMKKYDDLWNEYPMSLMPDEAQTELLIWKATQEQLKNGTGDSGKFPGGYQRVIDQTRPGNTVYFLKFVQPGKTTGLSFDGLVYVNSHWVLFPKPWRVL